jgi:hypothetical protein
VGKVAPGSDESRKALRPGAKFSHGSNIRGPVVLMGRVQEFKPVCGVSRVVNPDTLVH